MNKNLLPDGAHAYRRAGIALLCLTLLVSCGGDADAPDTAVDSQARSATFLAITVPPVPGTWIGIREDGTLPTSSSVGRAVATDPSGNVLVAGWTDGVFELPTRANPNPFVAKYTALGARLWGRLINEGNPRRGTAYGVATDSLGNIYVTGDTTDQFAGQTKAGGPGDRDVFVVKYDPNGNRVWARQFGSPSNDTGRGIAVDSAGNVFVAGHALGRLPQQASQGRDYFIAKFDGNGDRLWLQQTGTVGDDEASGVAVDAAGNAYVGGTIYGRIGNQRDAFVVKYRTDGAVLWQSEILAGIAGKRVVANALAASADGNAIYLAGWTYVNFELPGNPAVRQFCCPTGDAFVARFDGNGARQWIHNLSSDTPPAYFDEHALGAATTSDGSAVFVTGYTQGTMLGEVASGAEDVFVARYEADGSRTWVRQLGSDPTRRGNLKDRGYGIALDPSGSLFVAGESTGTFGTPNRDTIRSEWFVFKMRPTDGAVY